MQGNFSGGDWITLADTPIHQSATDTLFPWRHGNRQAQRRGYDADGRISSIVAGTTANSSQNPTFGYTTGQHTIASLSNSVQTSRSASFSYDPNDRLDQVIRSSDAEDCAWDLVGNRLAMLRNGHT